MSRNADIDLNLLPDEAAYQDHSASWRDPSSPSWIFSDDHYDGENETDRWARETALDFEEWKARNSFWDENEPDADVAAFNERQDSRRFANWLVEFHRKQGRQSNNDRWRKGVQPLIAQAHIPEVRTILRAMAEALPFAPGMVVGTVFVNPDGSRHETIGTSPLAAKAAYCKRHQITDEFVSVERVQYEHEKVSRYVVGMRRNSAETPSNWYDPNPSWQNTGSDGDPTRAYDPCGNALIRVPQSGVFRGHRLTVRELEQSIIAGSEMIDTDAEELAMAWETEPLVDYREIGVETGGGKEFRNAGSLNHEESYLYALLRRFELTEACDILLSLRREIGDLQHYFSHHTNQEALTAVLLAAEEDDKPRKDRVTGKQLPPSNEEPMFPYVASIVRDTVLHHE